MPKRIVSKGGGIGESRTFNSPAPDPVEAHINGANLAEHPFAHAIPQRYSDEGMQEFEQRPKARVEVRSDAFDKRIAERRDFRTNEREPWMAPDPMKEIMDAHVPAGYTGRFLSDAKVQRDGRRGWQPVIDANGDPVKLGNMTLGVMPKDSAARRNMHYRAQSEERVSQVYEQQKEQMTKDLVDAGMRPAKDEVGFQRSRGNTAVEEIDGD